MVAPRRASSPVALSALVAANLLPLAGVVWWGWSVFEVLVLYWLETGIVGALNVPKILLAHGEGGDATDASTVQFHVQGVPQEWFTDDSGSARNVGVALFFVLHYGIFWVVHGAFVFALPLFALGSGFGGGSFGGGPFGGTPVGIGPSVGWGVGTSPAVFALAVGSMALSHGVSFAVNYLGRGEYRATTADEQMTRPYGRVVVLHLTVLFGAWVVAALGSPLFVLALLVALKTALDLGAHLRERARVGPAPEVA